MEGGSVTCDHVFSFEHSLLLTYGSVVGTYRGYRLPGGVPGTCTVSQVTPVSVSSIYRYLYLESSNGQKWVVIEGYLKKDKAMKRAISLSRNRATY